MKKLLTFILVISCWSTNALKAQSREVWMLGPMLHYNIGGEKNRFSFAIELAYWNYEGFPYSADAGIEFEKQKIRLYSELQTGIGLAGLAIGPVFEVKTKEKKVHLGLQGSLWANYFLGFDVRFRKSGDDFYLSPGTYFKLPVGYEGNTDADGDIDWDWD